LTARSTSRMSRFDKVSTYLVKRTLLTLAI
jgi:hypothetical protein